MVSLAETMSAYTCEFCGSTENVGHTKGWVYTICKDCYSVAEDRISQRQWEESQRKSPEVIKELRKIKLDKLNKKNQI